jgi:thermostable 8-oxoguanine DNA glycosylase
VLDWSGDKLRRLSAVVAVLIQDGIETEADLKTWLTQPDNIARLHRIKGVKDKTVDYLKILVGLQALAIDRHLFGFLARAGIVTNDYARAYAILTEAAAKLGVEPSLLDHSIWKYMSGKTAARACAGGAGS